MQQTIKVRNESTSGIYTTQFYVATSECLHIYLPNSLASVVVY
jgi:hypothetical protein